MRRSILTAAIMAACLVPFISHLVFAKEQAPLTIEGASTISVGEAKELFDQGAIFIDPRGDAGWEAGRIPGAIHLTLNQELTMANLSKVVGKDEPVIFYCNGIKCDVSGKACAKAVSWGFSNVRYFREGLPGWESAGFPIE